MIDPQVIAKRLREARETTKDESTALTEQLAIIDAVIDDPVDMGFRLVLPLRLVSDVDKTDKALLISPIADMEVFFFSILS